MDYLSLLDLIRNECYVVSEVPVCQRIWSQHQIPALSFAEEISLHIHSVPL